MDLSCPWAPSTPDSHHQFCIPYESRHQKLLQHSVEVELFKTIQQRVKLISIYLISLSHTPQKHPKMLANISPFSLPFHSPRAIKPELHHCFSIAMSSHWKAKLLEIKMIWLNYTEIETDTAELQGNRRSLPEMPRELLLHRRGHLLCWLSLPIRN